MESSKGNQFNCFHLPTFVVDRYGMPLQQKHNYYVACGCAKYLFQPEREHDQLRGIRVARSEGSAHEPDKSGANAVTPWVRSLWAG